MSITLIVVAALAAAPAPASLPTLAVPPIVVDLNALSEVSKIAIANAIEIRKVDLFTDHSDVKLTLAPPTAPPVPQS